MSARDSERTSNADRLARRAAAFGQPSRARMLLTLMDGTAHAAGNLAVVAGVSAATASAHLAALAEAGLVIRATAGRQRLYRIASHEVADALETLLRLDAASGGPAHLADSRQSRPRPPLHLARTCYDHMAGRLGVCITRALLADGALAPAADERYELTAAGEHRLARLGIDCNDVRKCRRAFATACIDWTEREPHVGGALGAALCRHALEARWVTRMAGSRSLQVTDQGWRALRRHFGIARDAFLVTQRRSPGPVTRPGTVSRTTSRTTRSER